MNKLKKKKFQEKNEKLIEELMEKNQRDTEKRKNQVKEIIEDEKKIKVIKEIFGEKPPEPPKEEPQKGQGNPEEQECNGGQSEQSSGDGDSQSQDNQGDEQLNGLYLQFGFNPNSLNTFTSDMSGGIFYNE